METAINFFLAEEATSSIQVESLVRGQGRDLYRSMTILFMKVEICSCLWITAK